MLANVLCVNYVLVLVILFIVEPQHKLLIEVKTRHVLFDSSSINEYAAVS